MADFCLSMNREIEAGGFLAVAWSLENRTFPVCLENSNCTKSAIQIRNGGIQRDTRRRWRTNNTERYLAN